MRTPSARLTAALLLLALSAAGSRAQPALPGDADGSGILDEADLDALVAQLLAREDAAGDPDCTHDGATDLRDAVCVVLGLTGGLSLELVPSEVTVSTTQLQELRSVVSPAVYQGAEWSTTGGAIVGGEGVAVFVPPQEPGTYTVTATSLLDPTASGSTTVHVVANPIIEFVSDQSVGLTGTGDAARLEVRVVGSDGTEVPDAVVSWESDDPSTVSVAATGPRSAIVTAQVETIGTTLVRARHEDLEAVASVLIVQLTTDGVSIGSDLVLSRTESEIVLQRTSATELLAPGNVLVSGGLAGLLDRVLGVSLEPDVVRLATEPAALTDAVAEMDADVTGTTLDLELVVLGDDGEGGAVLSARSRDGRLSFIGEIEGWRCVLGLDAGTNLVSVEGPSVSFRHSVTPRITLRAGLLSGVQEFSARITASLSVTASTGSVTIQSKPSASVACFKNLAEIPLPRLQFYMFTFGFTAKVPGGVELSVSKLTEQVVLSGPKGSLNANGTAGVRYVAGGGWSTIGESSVDGTFDPFSARAETVDGDIELSFGPFAKLDLGLSAGVGFDRFRVDVANLQFAELKGFGYIDVTLPVPSDPDLPTYGGPSWALGVGISSKLKIEIGAGDIGALVGRLGIQISFNLGSAEIFNLKLPLLQSPRTEATVHLLTGGAAGKGVTASVGDDDQVVIDLEPRRGTPNGTATVRLLRNATPPLQFLEHATMTNGRATVIWRPEKSDAGTHGVYGRMDVGLLSAIKPYASIDAPPSVTVVVPEVQLPALVPITAVVGETARGTLSIGNAGTGDLRWAVEPALLLGAGLPVSGTLGAGQADAVPLRYECPLDPPQVVQSSIRVLSNDSDANQRDVTVPVPVTCRPNSPPTATLLVDGPSLGNEPFQPSFTWTAGDPDPNQTLSCNFDPGDGTGAIDMPDCRGPGSRSHVYQDNGTYTASLSVTDPKGATTVATAQVEVNAVPVIDAFTANPDSGPPPLEVSLDWTVSDDDDNDVLSCTVEFGDGASEMVPPCELDTSRLHEYALEGTYTARLEVDDGRGGTTSASTQVVVQRERKAVAIARTFLGSWGVYAIDLNDGTSERIADLPADVTVDCPFGETEVNCLNSIAGTNLQAGRLVVFGTDYFRDDLMDPEAKYRAYRQAPGEMAWTKFAESERFASGQRTTLSPDGARAVFQPFGALGSVFEANVDGSGGVRMLFDRDETTAGPPCGLDPIWLRDGSGILTACGNWFSVNRTSGIAVYSPTGNSRTTYLGPAEDTSYFRPVPRKSGRYLANVAKPDFTDDLQQFAPPATGSFDPTQHVSFVAAGPHGCSADPADDEVWCLAELTGTVFVIRSDDTKDELTLDPSLFVRQLDFLEAAVVP